MPFASPETPRPIIAAGRFGDGVQNTRAAPARSRRTQSRWQNGGSGRQLRDTVARLKRRQQEALTLRLKNGLSFEQAGERLGCSKDGAKML